MGLDDEAMVRTLCDGWQREEDLRAFKSKGRCKGIYSFKGSGAPHTGQAGDREEVVVPFVCVRRNRAESERISTGTDSVPITDQWYFERAEVQE